MNILTKEITPISRHVWENRFREMAERHGLLLIINDTGLSAEITFSGQSGHEIKTFIFSPPYLFFEGAFNKVDKILNQAIQQRMLELLTSSSQP